MKMEKIFNFHLEFLISFGILYGFYLLFLRKETFFAISRFYLLTILILSAVISLANFKIENDAFSNYRIINSFDDSFSKNRIINSIDNSHQMENDKTQTLKSTTHSETMDSIDYPLVILIVYLIGTLFMFANLIRKHIMIRRFLNNSQAVEDSNNGIKIVEAYGEISPFSYFKTICLPTVIIDKAEKEQIITHELAHIKLGHSYDIFYYEIFRAIFWFNPLIYLIGKSIKDIHEFEADKITLNAGFEKSSYMNLVLNLNIGEKFVSLANNFNQSTTLKRFTMINKRKSGFIKTMKLLYLIPIFGLLIYQFSCTSRDELNLKGTVPQYECTKVPIPEVGYQKFYDYLDSTTKKVAENLKDCKAAKIIVSYNVYPDGTIRDVVAIKGKLVPGKWKDKVGYGLDEKAVEIVKGLPKYIPGEVNGKKVKVNYRIPIKFGDDSLFVNEGVPSWTGGGIKDKRLNFMIYYPESTENLEDEGIAAVFTSKPGSKIFEKLRETKEAKAVNSETKIVTMVKVDKTGLITNVKILDAKGTALENVIKNTLLDLKQLNPPYDKNGKLLESKELRIPFIFTFDQNFMNFPEKKFGI